MAAVLTLKRNTTSVMDLLAGNVRVKPGGWSPRMGAIGEPVWESFDLVGRATSDANLVDSLYDLQNFISGARRYASNNQREEPHWLHFASDPGAEARALVLDGDLEMPADGVYGALLGKTGKGYVRLNLLRSNWFENATAETDTTSGLSAVGGKWVPTVTTGDIPSRIASLTVSGATSTIDDVWVGIRPTYDGTADFVAAWSPDLGTLGTDCATSALGVTISFATNAAMVERFRVSVSQISASGPDDFIGNYLVLALMGVSGALTTAQRILIRLYQGLLGGEIEMTGETTITPTDTNAGLYEIGYFRIPPPGFRFAAGAGTLAYTSNSTLYFYAQRMSGTNTLTVQKLVLIPTEPLMVAKGAAIGAATDNVKFWSTPLGDAAATRYIASSTSYGIVEHSVSGPMLWPHDSGIVVVAAQDTNNIDKSVVIDLSMVTNSRFSLFRAT